MDYSAPVFLVVIGLTLMGIGVLTWRHPLWMYIVWLRLGDMVMGGGPEREARWIAAHPEAESMSRLLVGCPFFFIAFLALSCGLITLLFMSGWGA